MEKSQAVVASAELARSAEVAEMYFVLGDSLSAAGHAAQATAAWRTAAGIEYFARPDLREGFGGAFNNQQGRRDIFADVLRALSPATIVETGTFRGSTTEYMAQLSDCPLFTAESYYRYFHYSQIRLAPWSQVEVVNRRSPEMLSMLAQRGERLEEPAFFYLDAHSPYDLPLLEELALIKAHWRRPVIMIDDFQVDDDPGYRFDDYGSGRRLSLSFIAPSSTDAFAFFYPMRSSAEETGPHKRGSVVLCRHEDAGLLGGFASLRRVAG